MAKDEIHRLLGLGFQIFGVILDRVAYLYRMVLRLLWILLVGILIAQCSRVLYNEDYCFDELYLMKKHTLELEHARITRAGSDNQNFPFVGLT